jgi:hypothetical protein
MNRSFIFVVWLVVLADLLGISVAQSVSHGYLSTIDRQTSGT